MSSDTDLDSHPSLINKKISWELSDDIAQCGNREFTEKVLQEDYMLHERHCAKHQY